MKVFSCNATIHFSPDFAALKHADPEFFVKGGTILQSEAIFAHLLPNMRIVFLANRDDKPGTESVKMKCRFWTIFDVHLIPAISCK